MVRYYDLTVREDDYGIRPAGPEHKTECVCVVRDVLFFFQVHGGAGVGFEKPMPASWDAEQCEFHLNWSSWCKSNLEDDSEEIAIIAEALRAEGHSGCLCSVATISFVGLKGDGKAYVQAREVRHENPM